MDGLEKKPPPDLRGIRNLKYQCTYSYTFFHGPLSSWIRNKQTIPFAFLHQPTPYPPFPVLGLGSYSLLYDTECLYERVRSVTIPGARAGNLKAGLWSCSGRSGVAHEHYCSFDERVDTT